jgi:hypothetical protein
MSAFFRYRAIFTMHDVAFLIHVVYYCIILYTGASHLLKLRIDLLSLQVGLRSLTIFLMMSIWVLKFLNHLTLI